VTAQPLLVMQVRVESDVFAVRQRGREVAAVLGLDTQDQIRVATALSEVSRELVVAGGGAVRFGYGTQPYRLSVEVTKTRVAGPPTDPETVASRSAARRLMDDFGLDDSSPEWLQMTKLLPARHIPLDLTGIDAARAHLRGLATRSPLDEMRAQNSELLATLDELQASKDAVVAANAELEETNVGVMAMYGELSAELEQTNRGVVALYAELDDKGQQLKLADESKSRFLASVSHELRTPLNSILGLTGLLMTGGGLDDEQSRQCDLIAASARELLALVNELLDLAKAESGRLEAVLAPTDLAAVLRGVHAMMLPLATNPGVGLVVAPCPDIGELVTDQVLLVHILRNLISNALKFTPAGTVEVKASVETAGHTLRIAVSDTGIGIPVEEQESVFEEFHQVSGPLQVTARGTGLGLPFARRLAGLLGGQLLLDSETGRGSTFVLELPMRADRVVSTVPRRSGAGTDCRPVILVVDDDPTFRHVLRGMLQPLTSRVLEAADGHDALEALDTGMPDMVFLDLRMPRMDGAEVLVQMNGNPAWRDIPVIVTTSVDIDGSVLASTSLAAGILSKSSISPDLLSEVISAAVGEPS
jgi:signal transduction histidine kinase/CheY-like chemotaxis protein